MKLSTAIALGRVLPAESSPYTYCGCALSIGLRATGLSEGMPATIDDTRSDYGVLSTLWFNAESKVWPWIEQVLPIPSWVSQQYSDVARPFAYLIISDIFAMVTRGEASLDQLIDWIKSVEPAEAEPASQEELCTSNLTPSPAQPAKATVTWGT